MRKMFKSFSGCLRDARARQENVTQAVVDRIKTAHGPVTSSTNA
jgi:hypothetical protein